MKLVVLLTLVVVLAAACGSSATSNADPGDQPQPTTVTLPGGPVDHDVEDDDVQPDLPELASEEIVFVWSENGGCAQAGPNCARYEVLADGTVNTYRQGEDAIAVTGSVELEVVNDWLGVVAKTDVEALRQRLGSGEMTAAFDGVDFLLEAPHAGLSLDSVDVEFSVAEPVFQSAAILAKAAAASSPLEFKMR